MRKYMRKYMLVIINNYHGLDAKISFYDTFEEAKKKLNESYEFVKSDEINEVVLDDKSENSYYIIQEYYYNQYEYNTYETKAFIERRNIKIREV